MSKIRLAYIKAYRDRHGKVRHYVRRRGHKLVPLPGQPGSNEFMAAYANALEAEPKATTEIGASRTRAGSVSAMIVGYMASADFAYLAPATQQQYRRIFERLRREHGDRSIATLERKHVAMMVDAKAKTPVGARDFLRCLRLLCQYAIKIGVREDDPTFGTRVKMPRSDGHRTWGEEDIARFEAAYPVGTKPRLALALLLGTGQRRSDVVKIGRRSIRRVVVEGRERDVVRVSQQKTGKPLDIPILSFLAEAIKAAPVDHLMFLIDETGKPFTPGNFTKWFTAQCRRIGLTGLSPHGLRKAAARRFAEAGCSANQIASYTGHASLREVARYTAAADQLRMAVGAMERLEAHITATSIVSPSG